MIERLPDAGLPDAGLPDDSVGVLISRALADLEQVARAEVELRKVRALAMIGAARTGSILLVLAVVIASLASIALVVGALLILQHMLGPIWATSIVVGTLVVASGVLGWLGVRSFKTAFGTGQKTL